MAVYKLDDKWCNESQVNNNLDNIGLFTLKSKYSETFYFQIIEAYFIFEHV